MAGPGTVEDFLTPDIYMSLKRCYPMAMNTVIDEWGHDPTVQRVRRLFKLMENEQDRLIKQLDLSSSDARLRHCRETALGMYENACGIAAAKRLAWDENTFAAIYINCFIRVLEKTGVRIPAPVLAAHQSHADLLREVLG